MKKYKRLTAERLFLDKCQKYFFPAAQSEKKILLGVEVATADQVKTKKKALDHLGLFKLHDLGTDH